MNYSEPTNRSSVIKSLSILGISLLISGCVTLTHYQGVDIKSPNIDTSRSARLTYIYPWSLQMAFRSASERGVINAPNTDYYIYLFVPRDDYWSLLGFVIPIPFYPMTIDAFKFTDPRRQELMRTWRKIKKSIDHEKMVIAYIKQKSNSFVEQIDHMNAKIYIKDALGTINITENIRLIHEPNIEEYIIKLHPETLLTPLQNRGGIFILLELNQEVKKGITYILKLPHVINNNKHSQVTFQLTHSFTYRYGFP